MKRIKCLVVLLAFVSAAHAAPDPSMCDTLPSDPINPNVVFENDIQPIFTGGGAVTAECTACHSPNSSGNLGLSPLVAHANLVNVNASQDPSIKRVLPFDAAGSLLFRKVNCANPGVGNRMPRGRPPLSLDQQRLIRDWINQGAIKNAIFGSNFE
jgi:hypothetical protein